MVGGGVVGAAVARELARTGAEVLLLDAGPLPGNASWAGAGMLSPIGEGLEEGPFLELGLRALRQYPRFVETLQQETGITAEYRASGMVQIGLDEEEVQFLQKREEVLRNRGLSVCWLDPEELGQRVKGMSPGALGGLLIPEDHQVDNRALTHALRVGARMVGVRFQEGSTVEAILHDGKVVTGLELAGGTRVDVGVVVLAAGAWSGRIRGLPRSLPVRPVRGQMLALLPSDGMGPHMASSPRVYLVPRGDGRVLVGSTMEEAGYAPHPTLEGIGSLMDGALELLPGLADAPLVETWAGLRPGTPDGLPVLGPDPDLEGLIYATGHFRNGILLAPATAEIVTELVQGRTSPVSLASFEPQRWDREGSP